MVRRSLCEAADGDFSALLLFWVKFGGERKVSALPTAAQVLQSTDSTRNIKRYTAVLAQVEPGSALWVPKPISFAQLIGFHFVSTNPLPHIWQEPEHSCVLKVWMQPCLRCSSVGEPAQCEARVPTLCGKGLIANYWSKMRRLCIRFKIYALANQGWQTIYDYFVNVSPVTSTISW